MNEWKKISCLAVLSVFVLLLSGCRADDARGKLKWLDEKAGRLLNELTPPPAGTTTPDNDLWLTSSTQWARRMFGRVKNNIDSSSGSEAVSPGIAAKDLSGEQKQKINDWLKENNYNRYGDPAGTFYVGGTPLFNEKTGERIERFEYILKNHPDILAEIE